MGEIQNADSNIPENWFWIPRKLLQIFMKKVGSVFQRWKFVRSLIHYAINVNYTAAFNDKFQDTACSCILCLCYEVIVRKLS